MYLKPSENVEIKVFHGLIDIKIDANQRIHFLRFISSEDEDENHLSKEVQAYVATLKSETFQEELQKMNTEFGPAHVKFKINKDRTIIVDNFDEDYFVLLFPSK